MINITIKSGIYTLRELYTILNEYFYTNEEGCNENAYFHDSGGFSISNPGGG